MAEVTTALTAQGLDASDLDANRAGRVSERQIARQSDVRRAGTGGVWAMALLGIVGSVGAGAWSYTRTGDIGILVFMAMLGLVLAAIPLGVFYGLRFADPAKVGACKVVRMDGAKIGAFLPAPFRGVYAINLDGKRYSGFANLIQRSHFGERANAYVVEEHRIVVALEPID